MRYVEARVRLGDSPAWPALVELVDEGTDVGAIRRWNGFVAAPWFSRATVQAIIEWFEQSGEPRLMWDPMSAALGRLLLELDGDGAKADVVRPRAWDWDAPGEASWRWPIGRDGWRWELVVDPNAEAVERMIDDLPEAIRAWPVGMVYTGIAGFGAEIQRDMRAGRRGGRVLNTIRVLRIYLDEAERRMKAGPLL